MWFDSICGDDILSIKGRQLKWNNLLLVILQVIDNPLITVAVDRVAPVVTCPDNLAFTVDFGAGGRSVTWTGPTVSDNSGSFTPVLNTHNPGQFFPTGQTAVTYIYQDAANNRNQCSFTVTITEGK